MPVERCVDHSVAWRFRFDRCRTIVCEGPLEFQPAIELPAFASERAQEPKRRHERVGAEIRHRRMDRVGWKLAAPFNAERFAQLRARLRFKSIEVRPAIAV